MSEYRPLLEIRDLHARYFKRLILHGVSLNVRAGEIVGVLGTNGAGKSTLFKSILGKIRQTGGTASGEILLNGLNIIRLRPFQIARKGIGFLVQGSEVFSNLIVDDNLSLALLETDLVEKRKHIVYSLFPRLANLKKRRAGLLSGGERKLLALGIVLMAQPRLLLLDEPTAGLSAEYANAVAHSINTIRAEWGTSILLVEQNVESCLALCSRAYFLRNGHVVDEQPVEAFDSNRLMQLYDYEQTERL
jgi:ABC-type branched-subunit amino acid transport system ATPase component